MSTDPLELYRAAERHAPSFANAVTEAARESRNERELQTKVDRLLTDFAASVGVELDSHEEYTLYTGRADAVHNRFVIEYEPPTSLSSNLTHKATAHAVGQAQKYILGVARAHHVSADRLIGVAFDGSQLIFVRQREGVWRIDPPIAWGDYASKRLLRAFVSLSSGRALITDNLVDDFGSGAPISLQAIPVLYNELHRSSNPLVQVLFRQWRMFFSQASGHTEAGAEVRSKPSMRKFISTFGLPPDTTDVPQLLFAVHTYFSFVAKTIANLILQRHAAGGFGATPLKKLANATSEDMRDALTHLEEGGLFGSLGFHNVLEGDLFAWYLQEWDGDIEQSVRQIIERLSEYDPDTIAEDPYAARDLLKGLYQFLIPKQIRHDLGEYYTPDWLANRVLQQIAEPLLVDALPAEGDAAIDLDKRILDPACGSGTFLILAIRAIKTHARKQGVSDSDILELICRNVVGVDINPLAVLAARVGYLLAISDLVPHRRSDVHIPVYMADSILKPRLGEELDNAEVRTLSTVVGDLPLPDSFASVNDIEALTETLYRYVKSGFATDAFLEQVERDLRIPVGSPPSDVIRRLYEKCMELEANGQNGIWARIIKNAFMPLFFDRFDYIVGNPPWINWESLPPDYRTKTKRLWERHGLFSHTGMDTILGGGRKDISSLMTYVVMADHLKDGGKLGFLLTQTLLKGASAGDGFRRFVLGGGVQIQVQCAEDLSALQPFEGASTRTALLVLRRGHETKYPIPYAVWRRRVSGSRISQSEDLPSVLAKTDQLALSAEPVDPYRRNSSWLTARKGALPGIRQVLGRSEYRAREGANSGGANAVYWLESVADRPDGVLMVTNRVEGAKRKVPQVTVPIERDHVYPLLRYSDIGEYRAVPSLHLLMVQDPITQRGIAEDTLQKTAPLTYQYLTRSKEMLRGRSVFKRFFCKTVNKKLVETGPFYSMFGIGTYTMAKYKVVWPNMGPIRAALVSEHDGKTVIPQHVVTLVAVDSAAEGHYLAACVNSTAFQVAAYAYSQSGGKSFGTPHILENIRVPTYEPSDTGHVRLSKLSARAHKQALTSEVGSALMQELDEAALDIWGIDASLLDDMRATLVELGGPARTSPS